MKRKLDRDDVPKEVLKAPKDVVKSGVVSFTDLGLDPRLLQGILKENYSKPTPVQAKAIPLALEGKDILARAKTGSGKTATYILPILHSILKRKAGETPPNSTSALILVPTRELAEQVHRAVSSLSAFCAKDIRAVNLTPRITDAVQRSLLAEAPDIVIATPARASTNVINGALSLDKLRHLVIDEADLVLSYGYDEDLQRVAHSIPQGVQAFLMSATLSNDVDTLKGLFCRDPVTLKLDDGDEEGSGVTQYVVKCGEDEKFLLIYVIFKLKLVKGKTIVFVGDIDRCYRLKLYLEQFGLRSCVLNSELPVNSRIHVVEEFNKSVYDIIIATDENEIVGDETDDRDYHADEPTAPVASAAPSDSSLTAPVDATQPPLELDSASTPALPPKKKRKPPKKDKEYGVSRGIDFRNVACVLNFDLPSSARSYTHRIGRTARAGATGMALSFVVPASLYRKHKPTTFPTAATDEAVLEKIARQQKRLSREVKPYAFDMAQLAAFRYRMDDALRAVTRVAVREARTRELRQELLKSEKLKRHFEENPGDLQSLRHDGELRAAKVQKHLRHVPGYLLPEGGAKAVGGDVGFVSLNKLGGEKGTRARNKYKRSMGGKGGKGGKKGGKKVDVLKSFRKRS